MQSYVLRTDWEGDSWKPPILARARRRMKAGTTTPFGSQGLGRRRLPEDLSGARIHPEGCGNPSTTPTYLNILADAVTRFKQPMTTQGGMPRRRHKHQAQSGSFADSNVRWQGKFLEAQWFPRLLAMGVVTTEAGTEKFHKRQHPGKRNRKVALHEHGKQRCKGQLATLAPVGWHSSPGGKEPRPAFARTARKRTEVLAVSAGDGWVMAQHCVGGDCAPNRPQRCTLPPIARQQSPLLRIKPSPGRTGFPAERESPRSRVSIRGAWPATQTPMGGN